MIRSLIAWCAFITALPVIAFAVVAWAVSEVMAFVATQALLLVCRMTGRSGGNE